MAAIIDTRHRLNELKLTKENIEVLTYVYGNIRADEHEMRDYIMDVLLTEEMGDWHHDIQSMIDDVMTYMRLKFNN
jgi:hypothetical protein